MSLFTLLGKEARVILRSRLLLTVLVLYPLVLVGIIGYAFSKPQQVPIAIVNEDIDPATGRPDVGEISSPIRGQEGYKVSSTQVIDRLRSLEFVSITETNYRDALDMLLTGRVKAVVRFPIHFADNIASFSSSGEVNITIDRSDLHRSLAMEITIKGIVQEFQEEVVTQKVGLVQRFLEDSLKSKAILCDVEPDLGLCPGFRGVVSDLREVERHGDLTAAERQFLNESISFIERVVIPAVEQSGDIIRSVAQPVDVTIRGESSGTDEVRDLIVPAALGLGIFWTGTIATSSLVVYERESAAYTRLRITPTTALSIYGSKILLTVSIILAQTLLILGAILLRWQVHIDNPMLTIVLIVLSTFASVGLGLFLGGLSRDVTSTVLLSILITFPMLFLSGLFYPVDFMPNLAQLAAQAFPLTYTVAGLRGSMLRGFDFADGQDMILALALFGLVLSTLGILLSKRLELKR